MDKNEEQGRQFGRFLIIIIGLLLVMDEITTKVGLSIGLGELNPVYRFNWLINLAVKFTAFIILIVLNEKLEFGKYNSVRIIALSFLMAYYFGVVIRNILLIIMSMFFG